MLKNFIGLTLTDEEMQDIPNPRLELYTHVTCKTVQFGSFLGFVVLGPIVNMVKGIFNFVTFQIFILVDLRSPNVTCIYSKNVEVWK